MTESLYRTNTLLKCLALLLVTATQVDFAAGSEKAPMADGLVNPAQLAVGTQPLPSPPAHETLQAPSNTPSPVVERPGGDAGLAAPSGTYCHCMSSIHQLYNSDCGCGQCQQCRTKVCHCGCGCDWRTKWELRKRECQAKYWGYPEYFCERPFGSCNYGICCKMIGNGLRDQQVLYEYDFEFGDQAWQLKDVGLRRLQKIAGRFHLAQTPLVIQASDDPQLDTQRQTHVMSVLTEMGLELTPDMVVVATPNTRSMDGVEGLPIYRNLLEQTRLRGNVGIESSALTDVGLGSSTTGSASAPAAEPTE